MKGWVYVITNSAMADLVKVGFTMKDPAIRAAELSNTGIPQPYDVKYEILIDEPSAVEREAHSILEAKNAGKEWFRCTVPYAVRAIREAVGDAHVYSESKLDQKISIEEQMAAFFSNLKRARTEIQRIYKQQNLKNFTGTIILNPTSLLANSVYQPSTNDDPISILPLQKHDILVSNKSDLYLFHSKSSPDDVVALMKNIIGPMKSLLNRDVLVKGLRLNQQIYFWEVEFDKSKLIALRNYYKNQNLGSMEIDPIYSSYTCEQTGETAILARVKSVDYVTGTVKLILAKASVHPYFLIGYGDKYEQEKIPNTDKIKTWDLVTMQSDDIVSLQHANLLWDGAIVEYRINRKKNFFKLIYDMPSPLLKMSEESSTKSVVLGEFDNPPHLNLHGYSYS